MPYHTRRHQKRNYKQLKTLTKKVNKITNAMETKQFDSSASAAEVNFDVNEAQSLVSPAQGDGQEQRIGDEISPFRLEFNYTVRSVSDTAPQVIRVLIIQSKQRFIPVTNVTTTAAAIWDAANTTLSVDSTFIRDNRSHFVVLYDRTHCLEPDECFSVKVRKKLSRRIIFQTNATTTEAGEIWLCPTSDFATASAGPTLSHVSRILYKDL